MFALQQTTGNHAVQRMLKSGAIQASIRIGQPNDLYELEADRVADQVMRMPEPGVQRQCSSRNRCPLKDKEEKKSRIQPKPGYASPERASVPDSFVTGSGTGQPLDPATRAFFEPRFGADFRDVRVHTGSMAAESAGGISARAYTYGTDIVFGKNQYTLGSPEGRRLLAHELTHVIQQGGAGPGLQEYRAARPVIQKLSTGPQLQRAGCPCCAESVSINGLDKFEEGNWKGHQFIAAVELKYPEKGPSGNCTLEWWEKTNKPYTVKMQKNQWNDMYALYPNGAPFTDWNEWKKEGDDEGEKDLGETPSSESNWYAEQYKEESEPEKKGDEEQNICGKSKIIELPDTPSLGTDIPYGTRELNFEIIVRSSPGSKNICSSDFQIVTARQILEKKKDGTINWENSSFTM